MGGLGLRPGAMATAQAQLAQLACRKWYLRGAKRPEWRVPDASLNWSTVTDLGARN